MQTEKNFGKFHGCVPSPADVRDYTIARLAPKAPAYIPEEYVLMRPAKIKDQGDIGSCVAHALASQREIGEAAQKEICELSPGYIYANRDGQTYFDEGMVPREAIASLKGSGVPRQQLFPYNDTYPQLKQKLAPVKPSCDADAQPRRITAYAQLFTAQNIKTALLEVGAVPAVFTLYDSFSSAWTDGIVPIPNPAKEGWVGSHMMLIIGWKKIGGAERWIVLNSWGQWWGDGGLCYIPVNGYSFDEAWSLTDEIYPASQDVIKTIQFSVEPELANQVTLDGVSFDLPTGIQMKNDRIMVPLRFFSESLGCFVKWDAAEKKITITTAGGEADSGGGATEIIMTIGESSYTLNGEPREMDVEPFIVDSGYTLVPLRAVTENLDCTVEWDAGTREATVTRK